MTYVPPMAPHKLANAYKVCAHTYDNHEACMVTDNQWPMGSKIDVLGFSLNHFPPEQEKLISDIFSNDAHGWPSNQNITIKKTPLKFLGGYTDGISVYYNKKIHLFTCKIIPFHSVKPHMMVRVHLSEVMRLGLWQLVYDLCQMLVPATGGSIGGWAKIISCGEVNYLELAYDAQQHHSYYFLYRSYSRKTNVVGKQGTATQYQGSAKGAFQLVAYDKAEQMLKTKQTVVKPTPVMRIEIRWRQRKLKGQTLAELPCTLNDPFKTTRLYRKKIVHNLYPELFEMAVETNCDLQKALKEYDKKERAQILKELDQKAIPDWWQPEEFWQEMLDSLQSHACFVSVCGGY